MVTPPALALGLLLAVVLDAAPAAAQSRVPSPPPRPPVTSRRETEADRLAAMIVRTTREYVATLERMRAAYKKEADSFAEMVEVRRDLFERGIISRRDVEIAEELLAEANRKVQEADRWIKDANDIRQSVLGEAALHSELAKTTLPPGGYMATGVDDEMTLRANREGFRKFELRPRRLVDVSKIDMSVEILGTKYDSPIVIAPTSSNRAFHPDAEIAVAKAANAGNHLQILSAVATTSIEDAIAARGNGVLDRGRRHGG